MFMNVFEMENFIIDSYDAEMVNRKPLTEKELLKAYKENTDILYQYVKVTVNDFLHPLSNEMRALFGHLAEYRSNPQSNKGELENAHGHFRRLNIDALKIICDEFDKSLSLKLKKQYSYDFREKSADYLKVFAEKYFLAKQLYMEAQVEERVGSDSNVHNVIALYHDAAKKYIDLVQYYRSKKNVVNNVKRKSIVIKSLEGIGVSFGLVVSILELFF